MEKESLSDSLISTFLYIGLAVFIALAVFLNPNLGNLPVPADEGLVSWLYGQKVVYNRGLVFDDYWTIKEGEVSKFNVSNIEKDSSSGVITAEVSFRATASGKGVAVSKALIRYREAGGGKLAFVDFVPHTSSKIGN